VSYRSGTGADTYRNNQRWWLWVPAFAGTTLSFLFAAIDAKTPERN